jgi:hypothetical protein
MSIYGNQSLPFRPGVCLNGARRRYEPKPCEICHEMIPDPTSNQLVCAKAECKREKARRLKERRLRRGK